MPHSLRVRLKNLWRNGTLSDKDFERLCKALDNEGVLDKIRAEIEERRDKATDDEYWGLMDALRIIDKYKGDKGVEE